eukprot:3768770-Rhodomonas_salina.1
MWQLPQKSRDQKSRRDSRKRPNLWVRTNVREQLAQAAQEKSHSPSQNDPIDVAMASQTAKYCVRNTGPSHFGKSRSALGSGALVMYWIATLRNSRKQYTMLMTAIVVMREAIRTLPKCGSHPSGASETTGGSSPAAIAGSAGVASDPDARPSSVVFDRRPLTIS